MSKKKKVKREISTGVSIFRYANEECPFCFFPKDLKSSMESCLNPYLKHSVYETHNIIISCNENHKKCEYYIEMKMHIKDLELTKKYIKKFCIKGWIGFKQKHFEYFYKKIYFKTDGYIRGLFGYFGFAVTKDNKTVEFKYLFTNKWSGLAINRIRYNEDNEEQEKKLKEFIQGKRKKIKKLKRKNV